MKRREFLKNGLFIAGTGILASNVLFSAISKNSIVNASVSNPAFSLEVVTDQVEETLSQVMNLIKTLNLQNITFTEEQMLGKFNGDIVMIYNNQLLNYKTNESKIASNLRSIANNFALPRPIHDPVLLSFNNQQNNSIAKFANVFKDNKLVNKVSLESDTKSILTSNSGEIEYRVSDGKIRITESSCKHKNCMQSGAHNHSGSNLVCIPSKIRISLDGVSNKNIDTNTY